MEKKIRKFVRSVLPQQLQAFLEDHNLVLPEDFSWRGKGHDYANTLVDAIFGKDDSHLIEIIVRIHDMHDEIGQTALAALFCDDEAFEQQKGEMGRSLWAFCHSEKHFTEAEQFAYLDVKRNTRQWSGFNGPKDKTVDTEMAAKAIFKEVLANHFKTKRRFKLEFLRRTRSNQEGQRADLIQLMIFQEGHETGVPTLHEDGDHIETLYFRPLEELALTYEPATGVIEVVSPKKDTRSVLAKAFVKAFLGYDVDDPKNVPLREYNLDVLKTPQNLMDQVEASDNIEDVRVTLMRLKPYDEKNFVTVEVAYQDVQRRSVYDVSQEWFSQNDPIKKPFNVKQVRIAVKFKGDDRLANGKLINVMVSSPNGCNLHEHTEQERLICTKYLQRWGLVTTL